MGNKGNSKIFISYGHDYTEEAKVFAKTLTDAGFDVWIDSVGITPCSDWRERITEGILSCDYFVALLSSYGLRKGGVCLDEIAIAVSRNRNTIRPVAMDKGVENIAPSSIASIQFFDMTEWRNLSGVEFDAWYEEKMHDFVQNCLIRTAPYDKRLSSIKSRLRFPEGFSRESFDACKEFRERHWLDEKIDDWLDGEQSICLLEGFPGFGKSCYCSEISHFDPRSCGLIYCDKYKNKVDGVFKLIREVSYAFAVRIPSFAMRLDAMLNDSSISADFDSPDEAFDFFILEPFNLIDGNMESALVVIDGVDVFYRNGENPVIDVFFQKARNFPRFAKIMLTARKTATNLLANVEVYRITAMPDDEVVYDDIKSYLVDSFDDVIDNDVQVEEISLEVAKRAQGSFLYASAIGEGIKNGSIDVKDACSLPSKVSDVYYSWLKQLVSVDEYRDKCADVLSVLIALENPPIDLIKNALDIRRSVLLDILRKFSSFLVKNADKFGNTCVSFYSDSFAEWICDEEVAGAYALYADDGAKIVADYLFDSVEEGLSEYEYVKAVSVLKKAGKRKRLVAFAEDEDFLAESLSLARRLQGKPDFYGEWNEILDGLEYLADFAQDKESLLVSVLCARARGEFVCGNLVGCGKIYDSNRTIIENKASEKDLLEYLYMEGTVKDYLGERDASLAYFKRLLEASENKHADYQVKALAGIIWNDHFNDLEEGLRNLELIDLTHCDDEVVLQAELIHARMLLSAGRGDEALKKCEKVFDANSDSIWGYGVVARKNQMLMIESIVVAYDMGDLERAVRYGELIYAKLKGIGGITECYCLSWLSLAYNKSGDYARADELLALAEDVFHMSCGGSLWLDAHIHSMKARYAFRNGDVRSSIELYKVVESLSEKTNDAWVCGDACFSVISIGYVNDIETDPDGYYRQVLKRLSDISSLPHLKLKSDVTEFLHMNIDEARKCASKFDDIPLLPSVEPEMIRAVVQKKLSQ